MDSAVWYAFIKRLWAEQEKLRTELEPYLTKSMRVGIGPPGGPMQDCTDERIATIKGEIASLQRTIDNVIAEQGLRNA